VPGRDGIADRVEIEALCCEFVDAAVMRDFGRFASLFTDDGAWRVPYAGLEFVTREAIRDGIEQLQRHWQYFLQATHSVVARVDGDEATGRAYIVEFGKLSKGRSQLHWSVYHDRYRRTVDGWKFQERVYEILYFDTAPLTGSVPGAAFAPRHGPSRSS